MVLRDSVILSTVCPFCFICPLLFHSCGLREKKSNTSNSTAGLSAASEPESPTSQPSRTSRARDRLFRTRRGLVWPYYTNFSPVARSVRGSNRVKPRSPVINDTLFSQPPPCFFLRAACAPPEQSNQPTIPHTSVLEIPQISDFQLGCTNPPSLRWPISHLSSRYTINNNL